MNSPIFLDADKWIRIKRVTIDYQKEVQEGAGGGGGVAIVELEIYTQNVRSYVCQLKEERVARG